MYRVYFVLQLVQMNNKFYGENQDCPLDLNHKPDKTPFKTLKIFSNPKVLLTILWTKNCFDPIYIANCFRPFYIVKLHIAMIEYTLDT